MKTRKQKAYPIAAFKAVEDQEGVAEAIVSVFDNVDYAGDRVVKGAFAKSLERWAESGDPIPVIFSHMWNNLDAHAGVVLEAKEVAAGEAWEGAPAGLWTKQQYDMDEAPAAKLFKLLSERRIREFSFAYDVLEEKKNGKVNDLLELDVIEVGPTLKGMNPDTALGDVKSDDAHGPTRSAKAWAVVPGCYEERQAQVRDAFAAWAIDQGLDLYGVYLEATFDDHAVARVELWSDPVGGGEFFDARYTVAGGTAELDEPAAVAIEAQVVAKAGAASTKSATGDEAKTSSLKLEEPSGAKGEGHTPRTASDPHYVLGGVGLAELEAGV